MKKSLPIFFAVLLLFSNAIAQDNQSKKKKSFKSKDKILHFGGGLGYSKPSMTMGDSESFEFYFANEKNETIKANYTWDSKATTKLPVYPNLYIQLDYRNSLFCRLDVFALWFSNSMNIKNSVDAGEFYGAYSNVGEEGEDNTTDYNSFGYNQIKMDWTFLGNSFVLGYKFSKTKTLRPYVIAGVSTLYLMKFGPSNIDGTNPRYYRTQVIFSSVDTFKDVTVYSLFGFGIKYRGLSLEFSYIFSSSVDNKNPVYTENGVTYKNNYESFGVANFSLKANLLSKNLNKNKRLIK